MNNNNPSPYQYVRPEVISLLASEDLFTSADQQPTRYSYAEAILKLGEKNPDVVVLDADVSKSIKTNLFAEKFPERAFNFGIAEQNMMAAAAGMATTGLIPYASTYAVFASMRALDMVRHGQIVVVVCGNVFLPTREGLADVQTGLGNHDSVEVVEAPFEPLCQTVTAKRTEHPENMRFCYILWLMTSQDTDR